MLHAMQSTPRSRLLNVKGKPSSEDAPQADWDYQWKGARPCALGGNSRRSS
jgi:hypothetical protein